MGEAGGIEIMGVTGGITRCFANLVFVLYPRLLPESQAFASYCIDGSSLQLELRYAVLALAFSTSTCCSRPPRIGTRFPTRTQGPSLDHSQAVKIRDPTSSQRRNGLRQRADGVQRKDEEFPAEVIPSSLSKHRKVEDIKIIAVAGCGEYRVAASQVGGRWVVGSRVKLSSAEKWKWKVERFQVELANDPWTSGDLTATRHASPIPLRENFELQLFFALSRSTSSLTKNVTNQHQIAALRSSIKQLNIHALSISQSSFEFDANWRSRCDDYPRSNTRRRSKTCPATFRIRPFARCNTRAYRDSFYAMIQRTCVLVTSYSHHPALMNNSCFARWKLPTEMQVFEVNKWLFLSS
ncbi:hypothetical protein HYFRA_00009417 [Hymenoscyphus fraxineus]|uniref:Uncharacterized protein n=1 Tax=Hymenoscyphus fraxineus TaxID=746836 RepID=A0A9N9PVF7_9HELO|nr:hypothetical protein HYFRA_00009417 [Hymenoscyphus fraxineus]